MTAVSSRFRQVTSQSGSRLSSYPPCPWSPNATRLGEGGGIQGSEKKRTKEGNRHAMYTTVVNRTSERKVPGVYNGTSRRMINLVTLPMACRTASVVGRCLPRQCCQISVSVWSLCLTRRPTLQVSRTTSPLLWVVGVGVRRLASPALSSARSSTSIGDRSVI